ncbi:MAG: hypothetical protein IJV71_11595 [Lachnospiraceae bacterium]|nr:hypothetical protein [Lachnospiraceae bacterium]
MKHTTENMKTVTILLTKYSDWLGRFISKINKNGEAGYSHASICLDEDDETFYSFNAKGFAIEKPKERTPRLRMPGSLAIRFQVPEHIHQKMQELIDRFVAAREQYTYSGRGVFLCLLHIPHKFEKRYFCSQFVAEVLERAGAAKLNRRKSLFLPNHFLKDIEALFSKKQLAYNVV